MGMDKRKLQKRLQELDSSLRMGEMIGEGGTSEVYELSGTSPAQVVKVIDLDEMFGAGDDRLSVLKRQKMHQYTTNEMQILRELQSCPSVMKVLRYFEYIPPEEKALPASYRRYHSTFFIIMEKVMPLDVYLCKYGATEKEMVRIAEQMCEALACCHQNKILHRDVKPINIFVKQQGEEAQFLLGDFGFCRRLEHMGEVTVVGTAAFEAPEIMLNQPLQGRFNADLYSLGASLYYLLSHGKIPMDFFKRQAPLDRLEDVSPEFERIIRKAIQPDPEIRYQTAEEMLHDLRQLSNGAAQPAGDSEINLAAKRWFLTAKLAMLNHDYVNAMAFAKTGYESGDRDCARLIAYTVYHEARDKNPELLKAVMGMLEGLMYEGDATAGCLYGILLFKQGEIQKSAKFLSESAQQGCAIAQYLYGRFLVEGRLGLQKNDPMGIDYLFKAAEQGFLPAIRILKRCISQNPNLRRSEEMDRMMELELSDYENQKRRSIITFL